MEYAQADLKKIFKSSMNLDLKHIRMILFNLLRALKFMHDCRVIHRDIKSANILVYDNCQVRLCDFSLARTLSNIKVTSELILQEKLKQIDISPESSPVSTDWSSSPLKS